MDEDDKQQSLRRRGGAVDGPADPERSTAPEHDAKDLPHHGLSTDELSQLRQPTADISMSPPEGSQRGPIPLQPPGADKTSSSGHRVRSTRLERRRTVTHEPRETVEQRSARVEVAVQANSTSVELRQTTLLGRTFLVSQLLLFEGLLLPGYAMDGLVAPWSRMADATSANFVSLFAFIILTVIGLLPLRPTRRGPLLLGFGGLLLFLSALLVRDGLNRDLFDGQPGVLALFAEAMWPALLLMLLATLHVAWVLYRAIHRPSVAQGRWGIVVLSGLALTYIGLGFALGRGEVTLFKLIEWSLGQPYWVDAVSALCALTPLVVFAIAWARFRAGVRAGWGWVLASWACWISAPLAIALLSFHLDAWGLVLAPVQCVSVLASGLLVAAMGLALSPPKPLL